MSLSKGVHQSVLLISRPTLQVHSPLPRHQVCICFKKASYLSFVFQAVNSVTFCRSCGERRCTSEVRTPLLILFISIHACILVAIVLSITAGGVGERKANA